MKELLKKLATFQQECPVILKDTTAQAEKFSYQYADLPAILEVINPLLKKHGLMFTQPLEFDQGIRFIRTIVCDLESGEILESRVDVPKVEFKQMNDYQALGSGITYMRRYALSSVLGIVTDKDTDAQGKQATRKSTSTDKRPWLNEKQLYSASERIKDASPYVVIDDGGDQLSLTPREFMDKLIKEYQMKNDYKTALETDVEFQETLSK